MCGSESVILSAAGRSQPLTLRGGGTGGSEGKRLDKALFCYRLSGDVAQLIICAAPRALFGPPPSRAGGMRFSDVGGGAFDLSVIATL